MASKKLSVGDRVRVLPSGLVSLPRADAGREGEVYHIGRWSSGRVAYCVNFGSWPAPFRPHGAFYRTELLKL